FILFPPITMRNIYLGIRPALITWLFDAGKMVYDFSISQHEGVKNHCWSKIAYNAGFKEKSITGILKFVGGFYRQLAKCLQVVAEMFFKRVSASHGQIETNEQSVLMVVIINQAIDITGINIAELLVVKLLSWRF